MATGTMTFESMTVGSAPSGELVAATGGPQVVSTANPAHGAKHLRTVNPGTAISDVRIDIAGATKLETVIDFYLSAPPDAEAGIVLVSGTSNSPSNAAQLTVMPTTGYLRLRTKGTTRWTSTFSVCDGKHYQIGLYVDPGTSATTGAVRVAVFDGDNRTTPLGDSGAPSAGSSPATAGIDVAGTVGAFQNLRVNKVDASGIPGTLDLDTVIIRTDGDAGQTFEPYMPAAAASVNPISVLSNSGGWTIQGGSATQAQAVGDASDTTFIRSAGLAANEEDLLRIPPLTDGNVTVTVRTRVAPSSTATAVKIEVLQGATVIGTKTVTTSSTPTPLSTSWADFTVDVPAALITDRKALRVRLTGNAA